MDLTRKLNEDSRVHVTLSMPIFKTSKIFTLNFGLVHLISLIGGPYFIPYASSTRLLSIKILIGTQTNQCNRNREPDKSIGIPIRSRIINALHDHNMMTTQPGSKTSTKLVILCRSIILAVVTHEHYASTF